MGKYELVRSAVISSGILPATAIHEPERATREDRKSVV